MGNACTSVFYRFHTTSILDPSDITALLARTYLSSEHHDIFIHESWLTDKTVVFNLMLLLQTVDQFDFYIISNTTDRITGITKEVATQAAQLGNGSVYVRKTNPVTLRKFDVFFVST